LTRPFSNWHHIIARIVAADASAAAAELDVIAASLADLRGETGEGARGIALVGFRDAMTDARLRQALLLLLAAVGLVLLIACANLASLLLTRAAARQREIAVRRALGAGRVRLVRQLVTESLTLAIAGGVAGLVVAWTSVRLLTWLRPTEPIPFGRIAGPAAFEPIVLDARVLAFNFGVALTAGVLFGLAPALVAARAELAALLRDVAAAVTPRRGVNRARGALVIGELAIALVLLAAAGLLGRSLLRLQAVDAGIDPERVLTAAIELPRSSYDAEQAAAFHGVLLERIRALPGVTEASVATSLPLARNAGATSVDIEGVPADDENPRIAGYHLVGGGYFGALGIPIERGRTFSERDRPGAPRVAIVNRTAERLLFPDGDALGRRIRLGVGYEPSDGFAEVVGVVGDVKYAGLDEPVKPEAYLAYPQFMENRAFLVLRSSTQPAALTSAVRRVVAELDPDLPVFDVRTMEQRVAAAGSHPRFSATLLGIFAAFALALAAVGVYGVVAYSVTSRMREIGIRRALGASDRSVLAEVMKEGALLAGGGVTLGLLGALAANRLLVSRLYDVTAADPATLATVATVLLLTAMLAAYLPSRRAVRIDPAAVLKDD
jgi:putative ABC transport system permease protein